MSKTIRTTRGAQQTLGLLPPLHRETEDVNYLRLALRLGPLRCVYSGGSEFGRLAGVGPRGIRDPRFPFRPVTRLKTD